MGWMRRIVLVGLLAGAAGASPLPLPPRGTLYHGVYPGGVTGDEHGVREADLAAYERAVGARAAWVYFSQDWFRDRRFPLATARWIHARGAVPWVRLMLRSDAEPDHAEPLFTPEAIARGHFDADLRAWARSAHTFGTPLIVEYGTEVNGEWFPWNGRWHGAARRDSYGNPKEYDGAERFRAAYRHIVDVMRAAGARNITWVFHVNNEDRPAEPWNRLEAYYPGDAWVDWLAVSDYGVLTPTEKPWLAFRPQLDAAYARLRALAPRKPIVLAEFGVAARNPHGDQAAWARGALHDLRSGRWPNLIGFSWWSEGWPNDEVRAHDTTMRPQDLPALAAAFRGGLRGGWVKTRFGVGGR